MTQTKTGTGFSRERSDVLRAGSGVVARDEPEHNPAPIRNENASEDVQQSAFPGAARSHDRDGLVTFDAHRYAGQSDRSLVAFGDLLREKNMPVRFRGHGLSFLVPLHISGD